MKSNKFFVSMVIVLVFIFLAGCFTKPSGEDYQNAIGTAVSVEMTKIALVATSTPLPTSTPVPTVQPTEIQVDIPSNLEYSTSQVAYLEQLTGIMNDLTFLYDNYQMTDEYHYKIIKTTEKATDILYYASTDPFPPEWKEYNTCISAAYEEMKMVQFYTESGLTNSDVEDLEKAVSHLGTMSMYIDLATSYVPQ